MTLHKPVLSSEVLYFLRDGSTYADCTFGSGAFSTQLLKNKNCFVYGIDQDENTIELADKVKHLFPNRFEFINSNFSNLENIFKNKIDGFIFDIGVSSMQIDNPERGFSFMKDGPLDMRMSKNCKNTAAEIIRNSSLVDLEKIILNYGEERRYKAIAKSIFDNKKYINTTKDLSNIILNVFDNKRGKIHPATKTFQALRIAVNDEFENLHRGIMQAADLLASNGVILVISFHGLECRIVKHLFRFLVKGGGFEFLIKKAIVPSKEEIKENNRSRSAKLRGLRKL